MKPYMILTIEEAKELQRFFFAAGYISYKHFESIHDLCDKIDLFLKENNENLIHWNSVRDESVSED